MSMEPSSSLKWNMALEIVYTLLVIIERYVWLILNTQCSGWLVLAKWLNILSANGIARGTSPGNFFIADWIQYLD